MKLDINLFEDKFSTSRKNLRAIALNAAVKLHASGEKITSQNETFLCASTLRTAKSFETYITIGNHLSA